MENSLCFSFYRTVRDLIQKYNELLQPLELTYTQYLVMCVLWECGEIEVKELCVKVCLDSNTLSPVINRLVKKGYVEKRKSENDKRVVIVKILEKGESLKPEAEKVHDTIYESVDLTLEERQTLINLLNKIEIK